MKTRQKLPIGGKEKGLQMFKRKKKKKSFSEQKIYEQKRSKNDSLGGGLLLILSHVQVRSREARKYVSEEMGEARGEIAI